MKTQNYKNILNPVAKLTSIFMLSALIALASAAVAADHPSHPAPHQLQLLAPTPRKSALVMRLLTA